MKTLLVFATLILWSLAVYSQTGSIRGTVIDNASGKPLPYITVAVLGQNPPRGTVTDDDGLFRIDNLPVGRYDIQATCVGYEPALFKEIAVSSAKAVFITMTLKESLIALGEVVVTPKVNKQAPLNDIASTSARMLSVEESSRYAGGFDDPARLVTAFAGVAGNVSTNAIAIRGNSPQSLQWKLEGVEIPNPTHFPDITGVGGGILTGLSSQVLGNSDFFTGAFPAEYSNALSGVFDMQLRNGNNSDYEHTVQIGSLGIEAGSEGPFRKGGKSSYLFNYRYSTMALADNLFPGLLGDAGGLRYQDGSFKLNFPTKNAGTFSVWGLGLIDHLSEKLEQRDTAKWQTVKDNIRGDYKQNMAAGGIGHKYFINDNTYIKTALAGTLTKNKLTEDLYNKALVPIRTVDMYGINSNISLNSFLNKKFSARHSNRTGINLTNLNYNLNYNMSPSYPNASKPIENFAKSSGSTFLASAFSNSTIRLNDKWTLNAGITGQYFFLNNNWSIEPRVGLKWQASPKHMFGVAYGKHSRLEKLDYYFVTTPESAGKPVNKDLDFAKANHLVFSYDWSVSDNIHLKIEPYLQYLYDIPVEKNSSFSIINQRDWFLNTPLVNEGKGKNYGVDITLERYLADGYYYLFTASLFESRYKGGDNIWRDTRLNRNYLFNALGGKEWKLGRKQQNVLSTNVRLSFQGGERFSPIDLDASQDQEDAVFDMSRAYEEQMSPAFTTSFTVSYKINRKKLSHEFAVKMVNATGYEEYDGHFYNFRSRNVEIRGSAITIPNVSYKIQF